MDTVNTITGLIAFVVQVAELSRKIADEVKPKPLLLADVVRDLTTLHAVLKQVQSYLDKTDTTDKNREDVKAITVLCTGCQSQVLLVHENLVSLQMMFSKHLVQRICSRSKLRHAMEEIQRGKEGLAAFKLTLTIALGLRTIEQTQNTVTTSDLEDLQAQISKLILLSNDINDSQYKSPMLQYINMGKSLINTETKSDTQSSSWDGDSFFYSPKKTTSSVTTMRGSSLEEDDLENVKLFGSYDDWLASFAPTDKLSSSALDVYTCATEDDSNKTAIDKTAKVKLQITNLRREEATANDGEESFAIETIDMCLDEPFHKLITILNAKGYTDICGFRAGSSLLSPLANINEGLRVTVTKGPSDYDTVWPCINENEPLEEFYDSFIRAGFGGADSFRVNVSSTHGQIRIDDTCLKSSGNISINRTLRVPENDFTFGLPALFGPFPMFPVERFKEKLPSSIAKKGGVMIPMYSREALSLGFSANTKRDESSSFQSGRYWHKDSDSTKLAIRVSCGGVNATYNEVAAASNKVVELAKQDFVVLPEQNRLDGFQYGQKDGRAVVRQFVAMAAGQQYSAEAQLTGVEAINGMQLTIAPPFVGRGEFFTGVDHQPLSKQSMNPLQLDMQAGDGVMMRGSGITARLQDKDTECDNVRFVFPTEKMSEKLSTMRSLEPLLSTHLTKWLRPKPLIQALSRILDNTTQSTEMLNKDIEMEAVYPISIRITHEISHNVFNRPRSVVRNLVTSDIWTLSPLLPLKLWCTMMLLEFPKRWFRLPKGTIIDDDFLKRWPDIDCRVLSDVYTDGDLVQLTSQVRSLSHPFVYSGRKRTRGVLDEVFEIEPGKLSWDMGIAPGAFLQQYIIPQRQKKVQWNWNKAQHVNIQILNAVVFKSFTGMAPPDSPISFSQYMAAGIPFYQLWQASPSSSISSSWSRLCSVSVIDLQKGIKSGINLSRDSGPVECCLCKEMLVNIILRPCNHVFCQNCVQQKMQQECRIICILCSELSSHQIHISGPMERAKRNFTWTDSKRRKRTLLSSELAHQWPSPQEPYHDTNITKFIERGVSPSEAEADTDAGSFIEEEGVSPLEAAATDMNAKAFIEEGFSPLEAATELNQISTVAELLRCNSHGSESKLAATCFSIICERREILNLILQWTVDHEPQPSQIFHAAISTATAGGVDWAVDDLLNKWSGSTYRNKFTHSMREAAKNGHLSTVAILLDAKFPVWDSVHIAAENGRVEIVELLCNAGEDIDVSFGIADPRRPIDRACFNDHLKTVSFLLSHGVSISKLGDYEFPGSTLLVMAARLNRMALARLFYQFLAYIPFWDKMICRAAQLGRLDLVEIYLQADVSPNARDACGRGILHVMMLGCSSTVDTVQNPFEYRKNTNSRLDESPLLGAISILQKYGADMHLTAPYRIHGHLIRLSAIHLSIYTDHIKTFNMLASLECNFYFRLACGITSLHLAAFSPYSEMVSHLLDIGLDPNDVASITGEEGTWEQFLVPLQCAIYAGNIQSVDVLLQRGAIIAHAGIIKDFLETDAIWALDDNIQTHKQSLLSALSYFISKLEGDDSYALQLIIEGDETLAYKLGSRFARLSSRLAYHDDDVFQEISARVHRIAPLQDSEKAAILQESQSTTSVAGESPVSKRFLVGESGSSSSSSIRNGRCWKRSSDSSDDV